MLVIQKYNWKYEKGDDMLKEERKVGPKGQVVIPKHFRKSMKIEPGSQVIFEITEDGISIKKPEEETEKVFEKIAQSGEKFEGKIKPHDSHDEELEDRL